MSHRIRALQTERADAAHDDHLHGQRREDDAEDARDGAGDLVAHDADQRAGGEEDQPGKDEVRGDGE